jgi:hypothetical protein
MLIYLIKEIFRSNILLLKLYLSINDISRSPKKSQVAVCGFPRSGNTFLGRVLRFSSTGSTSLVNHFHSSAQLIRSVKIGIPSVLILRDPVEVILSLYIGYQTKNKKRLPITIHYLRYLIYHISLLPYRKKLLVIHFHEIKNNPEYFISLYKKKYGGEFKNITNLKDEVLDSISRDMKPGNELKSSRPNKEKDDLKYLYKTNVESNILSSFAKIIHSKF